MTARRTISTARAGALLLLGSTLFLGGCDDQFGPRDWFNLPDTVDLYSLARTEFIGEPAAYDFVPPFGGLRGRAVIVERQKPGSPFDFDVAVTEDDPGSFLLLPAGVFTGFQITPGIFVDSANTFETVERAPREGYTIDEPVPAETGLLYVVRTRSVQGGCLHYAKMEVLELSPDGIATIRALTNPNCNDRALRPNADLPEEEDGGTSGT